MEIGDTIRFFRELKGYSQQGLADSIGVSQKTISRLETGSSSPTVNLLQKICEELEIDITSLLISKNQLIDKLTPASNKSLEERSVKELYNDLLKEKERHITALEKELNYLKEMSKSNKK